VVTVLTIDLLVEFAERDEKEGRILVRPALGTNLPFGDGFEKLLLAWSFLNVMGYVLSFSLPLPLFFTTILTESVSRPRTAMIVREVLSEEWSYARSGATRG